MDETRTRTALVVEDDEALRRLYATALQLRDFRVDLAEFAHEAMELLSHQHYDLVLVDLMLPLESGIYVVTKIRSLPSPRPDVIVVTGADSSAVKTLDRSVVRAIMFKPVSIDALMAYASALAAERHSDAAT